MRLRANQLQGHLRQPMAPIYWVTGDDPLLCQETLDTLRQAATEQGFDDRQRLDADGSFSWDQLYQINQAMSLFGSKQLIELRLDKKPDAKAQTALVDYAANPSDDNLLLIYSPKIESSVFKTKWFGKLDKIAVVIQIWPLERNQLPGWIKQRAGLVNLQLDDEAALLLADKVEGNLLAAKQEIEKLVLAGLSGQVDAPTLVQSVSDASRFTLFDLADPLLAGDFSRCQKVLHHLLGEGVDLTLINWLISKELRQAHQFKVQVEAGKAPQTVAKSLRIFDKRIPAFATMNQRWHSQDIEQLLGEALQLDQAIKGQSHLSGELVCQQLVARICGLTQPLF